MGNENSLDFSTILASIIHDVKNSLNIVLGSLDELIQEARESLPAERLGRLQFEARMVSNHLVQLLALYKMEQHQLSANIDEYPVTEFLDEALAAERKLLQARGIRLELQCGEDLLWYFDRELVTSVLRNAINNAMRHTRTTVLITADVEEGFLRLSVSDDGAGYPEEMLHQQAAGGCGIDMSSGCTGLGLYFSGCVAALHKNKSRSGNIVLSNGGKLTGACFSLYLP